MAGTDTVATSAFDPRVRRIWLPPAALAIGILAAVVAMVFPSESLDRGLRSLLVFLSAVAVVVTLLVWLIFLSGLPRGLRVTVAVLVALTAMATAGSIRRVEFSGDMVPTFDFRWETDRADLLEAHRARQQANESADAAAAAQLEPAPHDLFNYRGAARDGVIAGPPLARDWSPRPPQLVWRQPIGGGYASLVTFGPLVITIEQRRDREAIVAYEADTGRERWMYDYPALFSEQLGGDGPRATPTIFGRKVVSLGATGVLACLDVATGKPDWVVNILEQNHSGNIQWGMSGSPFVYDDLVLVNPGTQQGIDSSAAVLALRAASGQPQWKAGRAAASYASPMLATIAGVQQVVIFDAVGLAGYDPAGAGQLWSFPWKSDFDINAVQPVVLPGDRIFITSQTGAALVQIGQQEGRWAADEIWRNRKLKSSYACPIVYQDHIYGIDENLLACLDLATGKQLWKDRGGQYGHGQMLLRDDLLVVLAESGELALVEASPAGFHELGRIQAIEGKTWNNPALVGRRIFVRNHLEMAVYDLPIEQ